MKQLFSILFVLSISSPSLNAGGGMSALVVEDEYLRQTNTQSKCEASKHQKLARQNCLHARSQGKDHFACDSSQYRDNAKHLCFDISTKCPDCNNPLITKTILRQWMGDAVTFINAKYTSASGVFRYSNDDGSNFLRFFKVLLKRSGIKVNDPVEKLDFISVNGRLVCKRNLQGANVLMLACLKGRKQLIENLLKMGADPKIVSKAGETAMSLAHMAGQKVSIEALLNSGISVENGLHGAIKAAEERGDADALVRLQTTKTACEEIDKKCLSVFQKRTTRF